MIGHPAVHLCIDCRTPVKNPAAVICDYCVTDLENLFLRVDEVIEELTVTKTRQDVGGELNGGAGTKLVAPAPINLTALEAEMRLHKALMGWALRLVQERIEVWDATCARMQAEWVGLLTRHGRSVHHPVPFANPAYPAKPVLPGRTPHHLSNYLMGRLPYLATQPTTMTLKKQLGRYLDQCATACERAAPRIFAGVCPDDIGGVECGTYVYEPQGAVTARCKVCGFSWDITEWTGRALISKEYVIGYPPALSRMLTTGGVKVTEQDIRNWAARGQLDRANPVEDDKGNVLRPMYRLGDVLDAWQATSREKAA